MFLNEEYADMHFIYVFCEGNEYQAAEAYKRRYPKRRGPGRRVFSRVHRCLRETGSFPKHTAERQSTLNKQDEEMDIVERSPLTSVRRISNAVGISRMKVWRTLHENKLYQYHFQKIQVLLSSDYQARMECTFTRENAINIPNLPMWSLENPHEKFERNFQYRIAIKHIVRLYRKQHY